MVASTCPKWQLIALGIAGDSRYGSTVLLSLVSNSRGYIPRIGRPLLLCCQRHRRQCPALGAVRRPGNQPPEEPLAIFDCEKVHWQRRRTTNVIEQLCEEARRRIRTMYTVASNWLASHMRQAKDLFMPTRFRNAQTACCPFSGLWGQTLKKLPTSRTSSFDPGAQNELRSRRRKPGIICRRKESACA